MSGDLILEVNGQDLRTAAYEHVAYTLKVNLRAISDTTMCH